MKQQLNYRATAIVALVLSVLPLGLTYGQQTTGGSSAQQSTGGSAANGNTGGTGQTNSQPGQGATTPSGQGTSASSLQSEAKVLTYTSISDAMNGLVCDVVGQSQSGFSGLTTPSPLKPVFFLAAPFTASDVANYFELKRQLTNLNGMFSSSHLVSSVNAAGTLTTTLDLTKNPPVIGDDVKGLEKDLTDMTGTLTQIEADPTTDAQPMGAGLAASSSSTSPPAAEPSIKELSGIGADASQIGMITDAISGLLTLVQTFHSTYTVGQGSLGLDQATINSMLTTRLKNGGCRVFDFTQGWIDDTDYNDTSGDSFLSKITELSSNIDRLNSALISPVVYSRLVDLQAAITQTSQRITQDFALKSLSKNNKVFLFQAQAKLATMQPKLASVPFALALLKTANDFYQALTGQTAPQYTLDALSTATNSNSTKQAPSATTSTGSVTITIGTTGQAQQQSQNQTQTASPTGSSATTTLAANYVNLIAKFVLIDRYLNKMKTITTKQGSGGPIYLISCRVIVGDATEAKVSRFLLEDYVALSNLAVVQLQVFDPFSSEYLYSQEKRSAYDFVYFPSRVRDAAENVHECHDPLKPTFRLTKTKSQKSPATGSN